MMNDLLTQTDNDLLSAPATDQDMLHLSEALANIDTGTSFCEISIITL
jgi:hypothetical protein